MNYCWKVRFKFKVRFKNYSQQTMVDAESSVLPEYLWRKFLVFICCQSRIDLRKVAKGSPIIMRFTYILHKERKYFIYF